MEKSGPTNQLILVDNKIAHGLISPSKSTRQNIEPSSNPSDVVDPESDVEEVMESGGAEKNTDPYFVKWDSFFIDGISIDERGQLDKTSASILGFCNVN